MTTRDPRQIPIRLRSSVEREAWLAPPRTLAHDRNFLYASIMQAHREEATLSEDGVITLRGLPFRRGESVEVIVLSSQSIQPLDPSYPLRGTPFTLLDPFEPVAEGDWEAAK